jgi:quercetin dioxygenase-like cupin family protein
MSGMRVTRAAEAPAYNAPLHRGVSTWRLQGHEAGPTERFWVGLSHYEPGGGADEAPTQEETVYVMLAGELTVTSGGERATLGRHDSVHLLRGQVRGIHNHTSAPAVLLVIIAHRTEAGR